LNEHFLGNVGNVVKLYYIIGESSKNMPLIVRAIQSAFLIAFNFTLQMHNFVYESV